ncbi:3-hydroxyacyl-CoA dehydrogenase family protein [Lactobacillus sp. S2-2]|uniref:3-hydroxyacyl-CoA dehydrogenase family protein n=1 Tax=Lactobacillus sp. S2-2 TaxID=2692917 RepID=UPI001F29559A|nr:3-hydroxyacyl-CoA dehydrogenase family protein [Lactobacillus sp. S2-2]
MVPITINKEQPGYILNSLLVPFENAGFSLWINGIASPQDIDKTWMIATGSPLGPFAIADIIGMHTNYEITSQNKALQDVAAKFKEMIDDDKLGRENGKGLYTYPNPAYEQPDFLK